MNDFQQIRNNQNIGRYFGMIPHMADDDLDPYEYRLYGHYIRACGHTGASMESARVTAKITKMSVGKVSEARRELARFGYIKTAPAPNNGIVITVIDVTDENIRRQQVPSPFPENKKNLATKDRSGYVYLLKGDRGFYKIGRAKNPKDRMKTFGVTLPFDVEFECVIKASNMYELEAALHRYFVDKRGEGEWFSLSDQDVKRIKGMANVG